MPAELTYPGVYIEEISSGVRTITGVATSITAFIGRAKKGPVNKATTINNFGDYERIFGGLYLNSMMSYAVRDFYLNGGSQAVIVRLYRDFSEEERDADTSIPPSKTSFSIGNIKLEAAYEGSWGATLRATVETVKGSDGKFNLTVTDTSTGTVENFINLSPLNKETNYIGKILSSESKLIRLTGDLNGTIIDCKDNISVTEDNVKKRNSDWLIAKDNFDQARRNGVSDLSEFQEKVKKAQDALKEAQDALKASDGKLLEATDILGSETKKEGLYALEDIDIFNLLCIPPYTGSDANGNPTDVDSNVISKAVAYCEKRRAMLLVDSPSAWKDKEGAKEIKNTLSGISKNAAFFFPRLMQSNSLRGGQIEEFAPCGAVAGVIARTDSQRGIWKAPAGIEATLRGVSALSVELTNDENGELNPLGINCLRTLPNVGKVVWGARTLRGADILADEWKYLPVRRTALYIEESLYRGTQWVVFEPNDEPLWAQIRMNVGAFMHNLFRKGAFQGITPKEAYFVKCDKETTTQNDIDLGIVNILVGFAPLKPAEFVIIKLQQIAGNLEV